MSKAPQIPSVQGLPQPIARILAPIKEVIERMRGRRPGMALIEPLPSGATTNDIVLKINEIIERLQQ